MEEWCKWASEVGKAIRCAAHIARAVVEADEQGYFLPGIIADALEDADEFSSDRSVDLQ